MDGRNLHFPSHSKVGREHSLFPSRASAGASQPTQDVYGGLQDVLSQQEHPFAQGGLVGAAKTIGVCSLQEG